ncbi:GNAT family N-acetyltransferase [Brachybacterium halotolerans subsp. kimchii]|uniref:GNAT family N-acetyltransferase n=1 Tax=Brachybacterium halotolerans TaxID=2795215 RepID=UPI001E30CC11|nr:GNAT family N-acetyltransferase [Brachybacterium halotolerans]UEJ82118.1 GNAT family N-acetyltransferase [Brachybacterium halotolerans subsp. kimchii]
MTDTRTTPAPSITWEEVSWEDSRAAALRDAMDAEVGPRYMPIRGASTPPGRPTGDDVETVVLALVDGEAAATGTLRRLPERLEVKRLFVGPAFRRLGLARAILAHLENAARARGAVELFLQTGNRQPDAIALYEREGWEHVEVFAPYEPSDGISVCFRKDLAPPAEG